MQIEIVKNELAGALSALGKLVCRTSPVEVYRSLRIEGKENKISFQTVGLDEAITYTLPVEGNKLRPSRSRLCGLCVRFLFVFSPFFNVRKAGFHGFQCFPPHRAPLRRRADAFI